MGRSRGKSGSTAVQKSLSNRLVANLVLTLVFSAVTIWYFFLSSESSPLADVGPSREVMRRITVVNQVPQSVSLYFKDGTTVLGSYLEDVDKDASIEVLATPGDEIFATLHHGISKISTFTIREGVERYFVRVTDVQEYTNAAEEVRRLNPNANNPNDRTKGDEGRRENEDGARNLRRPPNPLHAHRDASEARRHEEEMRRKEKNEMRERSERERDPVSVMDKRVLSNRSGPHRQTAVSLDVRRETRTFPGVFGGVREIKAMPARFRSLYPHDLDMWYDNGADGVWQGRVPFGKETSTTTYEGHEFYFTLHDPASKRGSKKGPEVGRWRMHRGQSFYIIEDPSLQPTPEQAAVIEETRKELAYMQSYEDSTGSIYLASCRDKNRQFSPRPLPVHFMWPADEIGQVHKIQTVEGFWFCEGKAEHCQNEPSQAPELELEVLSLKPRAFVIKNFLSNFEADMIIKMTDSRMTRSSIGEGENAGEGDTRTSKNTWLPREKSDVTRSLFKRAADLLQIDESLIANGGKGITEQLQVVHYQDGQRYDPHYDWGATRHADRYITLLLYLTDMADDGAGGQTSFPRGQGRDGKPFMVHPGKGSAVLFYNILPDGNNDDASLHSATPVTRGEKFLANFWVWDPEMKH